MLTRERLAIYPWLFIGVYIVVFVFWAVTTPRLTDRKGNPKGGDFVTFYAASVLASRGEPETAYTRDIFRVEEQVSGSRIYHTTWDYPPTFLLIVMPFCRLPYLAALYIWLAITMTAYVFVVRRFAPDPLTTRLTLAFPGTYQNFIQGQNGFLTTALLGWGLLMLESRVFAAGLVLGLLSYKPHLAWMVAIALIAGRKWLAVLGAIVSSAAFAGISLLVFGESAWAAFIKNIPVHAQDLANGIFPTFKMPTVYGGAYLIGIGNKPAMVLSWVSMLAAMAAVFWVWLKSDSFAMRVSALSIGTCLGFPYLFDYDLAVLALAIAAFSWEAQSTGWLPGEKIAIVLTWSLPILATLIADYIPIQITPIVLWCMIALILRRINVGFAANSEGIFEST